MRRSGPTPLCTAVALIAFAAAAPAAGAQTASPSADCVSWAGEFDPLPTVADSDPLRARWARMRVDQLSQLAVRAEAQDLAEANRLWRRVQCLEPDSEAAQAGVDRTLPNVAAKPPASDGAAKPPASNVAARPASPSGAVPAQDDASSASTKRATARTQARPRPPRAKQAASVAAPLERTEQLIRDARFGDALGEIERLRPEAVRPTERARLEVLAATAQVAFGDEAAARASIERALRAEPALALDARTTSPKLLRVLDEARAVSSAPPYTPAAAAMQPVVEPAATE